jgi:hypothetical protein
MNERERRNVREFYELDYEVLNDLMGFMAEARKI